MKIKNNSSSIVTIVEKDKLLTKTNILPLRNFEERSYTIQGGESIEIVYPKSEPWLDWQENRPDNKPNGGLVIIKYTNEIPGYGTYDTAVWSINNSEWSPGLGTIYDYSIEKWAYIPE